MCRATVMPRHNSLRLKSTHDAPPLDPDIPPTATIGDLTFSDFTDNPFFNNLSFSDSTSKLLLSILNGSAIAASDGSYFPAAKVASDAWIVSAPNLSEYIQGGCILPGEYRYHTAHSGELGAQMGIASFFYHLHLPPLEDSDTPTTDCLSCIKYLSVSKEFLNIPSVIWILSLLLLIFGIKSSSCLPYNVSMDIQIKHMALFLLPSNSGITKKKHSKITEKR